MVIERCSEIDAYVVGSIIAIHDLICGRNKASTFYRPFIVVVVVYLMTRTECVAIQNVYEGI